MDHRTLNKFILNIMTVFALYGLTLTFFPVSAIAGLAFTLLVGYFLRNIVMKQKKSYSSMLDKIVLHFAEAYGFSLVLVSPLAYALPMLLGQVSFPVVMLLLALLLCVISSLRIHSTENTQPSSDSAETKLKMFDGGSLVTVLVWGILASVDIIVSIYMFYFSFEGSLFLFRDLTSHLSVIQGIATGLYPPPNLTFFGINLSTNISTLTLPFGYSAILISIMQLQGSGDLFVIILNAFVHAAVVPLLYYIMRGVTFKIKKWVILAGSLSIGFVTDLSPFMKILNIYDSDIYRGVPFPFDRPDGVQLSFFLPGVGPDAFLVSFHHLQALLLFIFIVGLVMRTPRMKSLPAAFVLVSILEIPFFHLGIGTYLLIGIVITGLGSIILKIQFFKKHLNSMVLFTILAICVAVGIFFVRSFTSAFLIFTPRFSGFQIIFSLLAYLGPTIVLVFLGYRYVLQMKNSSVKWLLFNTFSSILLLMLFYSTSRDSGAGLMPTDYFPMFALQTIVVLFFVIGMSIGQESVENRSISQTEGLYEFQSNDIATQESGYIYSLIHAVRYHKIWKRIYTPLVVLSILMLVVLSSLYLVWTFNTNIGRFNQDFYNTVPTVSAEERAMLSWIYDNSDLNDVILCDIENWELSAIIGRQIVYSGYRAPDLESPIYNAYLTMFSSLNFTESLNLFVDYSVGFVVISPLERAHFPEGCLKFYSHALFDLSYDVGEYQVFEFLG